MSGLLEPEVRKNGFMQTGTPKMLCCKHGGSRVNLSLWPFCGRSPGPTDTIWASFESYKLQSMLCFAGRTGWPDTYKKSYEMTIGCLPLSWNGRIFFWAGRRQLEKHETGPHQMAEARPEEKVRRRFVARY